MLTCLAASDRSVRLLRIGVTLLAFYDRLRFAIRSRELLLEEGDLGRLDAAVLKEVSGGGDRLMEVGGAPLVRPLGDEVRRRGRRSSPLESLLSRSPRGGASGARPPRTWIPRRPDRPDAAR